MHYSEERYLELLDSFNGMTETYHLTSLTVSPGVTEPYHLTLLDSFTWRYWTVSPDVTGQFHLALLKPITWCYSEYRTAIELFNMQQPTLKIAIVSWNDRNQHDKFLNDIKRSADRYLANNSQIKWALPALVSVMSNYCITGCIIHHS